MATKALSLGRDVSSSLIYPVIYRPINCYLKIDSNDLATIKRFKETDVTATGLLLF